MVEKKKVMIVEDSGMMQLIIKNMINSNPHLKMVRAASNAQEALEVLPAVEPDLILLDSEMPEMGGLDLLKAARLKTSAKIVVLSSAAKAGSAAVIQARGLGADAVISKPSGQVIYNVEEKYCPEFWFPIHQLLGIELNRS